MSNEHNLVCSFIKGVFSDCVHWCVFLMLKALDNFCVLFNIVFGCLAILYPGHSFQLTIGHMRFSCLCSFIMPCIWGFEDDSVRVETCFYRYKNECRYNSVYLVLFCCGD
jgi:hypothetical protein